MKHHSPPPAKPPRLWLALRLTHLPLNALGFNGHEPPARVVIEKQRVICASRTAEASGVVRNMDATTASLLSECAMHARDRAREQQAVAELAEGLYQFTPYIETYFNQHTAEAGLLLELSRCLNLFNGIVALARLIARHLHTSIYHIDYGLAHSAKGAWLLSYRQSNGQLPAISGAEDIAVFHQRLRAVPVQWLHDFPAEIAALENMGFDTLGDIARQIDAQSISSIKKRFGPAFADELCDIFAIEQNFTQSTLFGKPNPIFQPAEFFNEQMQFDFPISQTDQLHWPIENLLHKLSDYLRRRQLQCQTIEWQLYDIYRHHECITVHCDSAESHWQLFYDLTLIQLENRQLSFAVDTLELKCPHTLPLHSRTQVLAFDRHPQRASRTRDFAITAAKLKARLGDAALFKISYCDSHIPELSNICIPLHQACNQQLSTAQQAAIRPSWLLNAPQLIEEREQGLYWCGQLKILAGPERIQSHWWQTPIARDYFLAQRNDQVRLWIFQDLHKQQWFVHGLFA